MLKKLLPVLLIAITVVAVSAQGPTTEQPPDFEGTRQALLQGATQAAQIQPTEDTYHLTATQLIIEATQTADPTFTGLAQTSEEKASDMMPIIIFFLGMVIGAGGVVIVVQRRAQKRKL